MMREGGWQGYMAKSAGNYGKAHFVLVRASLGKCDQTCAPTCRGLRPHILYREGQGDTLGGMGALAFPIHLYIQNYAYYIYLYRFIIDTFIFKKL